MVFEHVLDRRIRDIVSLSTNQCGFVPRCGTTDAIHVARLLSEKHREKQKAPHIAFLDLEKAFDRLPHELIRFAKARCTREACRMGADSLRPPEELDNRREPNWHHKRRGTDLPRTEAFKYLISTVSFDGCLSHEVSARINATWLKWRSLTGVLCDKNIPDRLKSRIYRTVIRPVALYATGCWPATKEVERRLGVMEMKMSRWMLLATTISATKTFGIGSASPRWQTSSARHVFDGTAMFSALITLPSANSPSTLMCRQAAKRTTEAAMDRHPPLRLEISWHPPGPGARSGQMASANQQSGPRHHTGQTLKKKK
ncbi:hypothetical protein Y032_0010g985 [Ancylostoma ceylanicum]|uniref:Uncharacterized protein n=1 Tax=Ancylostoma ceylanicum TaxID=53326 RepID=A0A016VJ80_9BILA|nr:hypothetical protein Y032_0010g985 [Ancylostoma ceylanicum]